MKKVFVILICNLFTISTFSQSINDLDEKNGYKDLSFSSPLETIIKKTNAKLQGWLSTKDLDCYTIRNSEYEKFGNFSGTILLFKSKKDTLIHTIYFSVNKKGAYEFKELIKFFESLYGMETEKETYDYTWKGVKVQLILSYDYVQESTTINIINLEAESRYQEEKEKVRNKTKNEF